MASMTIMGMGTYKGKTLKHIVQRLYGRSQYIAIRRETEDEDIWGHIVRIDRYIGIESVLCDIITADGDTGYDVIHDYYVPKW